MEITELSELRNEIDKLDNEIIKLLAERFKLTEEVGIYKAKNNLNSKDSTREAEQFDKINMLSLEYGLNPKYASTIYECIINTVVLRHEEIKSSSND